MPPARTIRRRSPLPARARGRRGPERWARLSDQELLDLRFCDLGLALERTPLQASVERLYRELDRRGIAFRPHFWLSEEWFSPDGVPGVAIPFYLAHPRLMRLERRFMGEVEGGEPRWLTRILRHEAGHAIDTAYRLRRRRRWRDTFGPASRPYPRSYRPRPSSRDFVLHLGHWYAQSHPCEDFAETFAVWLQPRSRWRADYAGWPALRKLLYVEELMAELGGRPPLVNSRLRIEPLHDNRRTLRQHYQRKVLHHDDTWRQRYDDGLLRVFGRRERHRGRTPAAAFLRRHRPLLERLLLRRARLHPYTVQQVLGAVTARARELDLCVHLPQRRAQRAAFELLDRILHHELRAGRERFTL